MCQTLVLMKDAISKGSSSQVFGGKSLHDKYRDSDKLNIHLNLQTLISLATTLPGQGLVNCVDFAHNSLHLLSACEVLHFLCETFHLKNS